MNINSGLLKSLFSALIGLSLIACGDSNTQVTVDDKDVDLLVDAMLLEAALQDFSGAKRDSLSRVNYELLYERHGIDESDLEDLRHRFSQNPEKWAIAADSVANRLKRGRSDFDSLLNPELN
jgi:hypothetical protein